MAIQVVSGMKDEFDVVVSTDEFVNNPTVFKLGELVLEKILSGRILAYDLNYPSGVAVDALLEKPGDCSGSCK